MILSAIVMGAGSAGLSAARELLSSGLEDVLALDQAIRPGGLPLSYGLWGWGILDLHRILTGLAYADRLVAAAHGVEVASDATALMLALIPGGRFRVAFASGVKALEARPILLATDIRDSCQPEFHQTARNALTQASESIARLARISRNSQYFLKSKLRVDNCDWRVAQSAHFKHAKG